VVQYINKRGLYRGEAHRGHGGTRCCPTVGPLDWPPMRYAGDQELGL